MTSDIGRGVQRGPLRPDWGDGWAELVCDLCGASWVAPVGDPCWWCERAVERQLEHQAELVLRPPDVDPADASYPGAMRGWAERMVRAVAAGIVTRQAADSAWRRNMNRAA